MFNKSKSLFLTIAALSSFLTGTARSAVILSQSGNDLIVNLTADMVSPLNGGLSSQPTDEIAIVLKGVYSSNQSDYSIGLSPFLAYDINGSQPGTAFQSNMAISSIGSVADYRDLVLSVAFTSISFDGSSDVITYSSGTYTATGAFASGFVMPDVMGSTSVDFIDLLNEAYIGSITVTVVPEPSSAMLLVFGSAFALAHRKRVRK